MPFRRDLAIKKIIYHCQSTRYYFVMLMKRSGKSKLDNILLSVTFFLGKLTLLSWLTVDLMKTGNYLTGEKLVSLLLKSTLMRFLFDSRLFFLIRIQFDNGLNWYWINLANLICIEKCYLIYIKIYNSTFRNESFSIYVFEKKPRTLYNLQGRKWNIENIHFVKKSRKFFKLHIIINPKQSYTHSFSGSQQMNI